MASKECPLFERKLILICDFLRVKEGRHIFLTNPEFLVIYISTSAAQRSTRERTLHQYDAVGTVEISAILHKIHYPLKRQGTSSELIDD